MSTSFLKDIDSIRISVNTFKVLLTVFSSVSRLKPNINKCEMAGVGILKGSQEAVYGLRNIGLMA